MSDEELMYVFDRLDDAAHARHHRNEGGGCLRCQAVFLDEVTE